MGDETEENEHRRNDRGLVFRPEAHEAPLAQEGVGAELEHAVEVVDGAEVRADPPVEARSRFGLRKHRRCDAGCIVGRHCLRDDQHPARIELRRMPAGEAVPAALGNRAKLVPVFGIDVNDVFKRAGADYADVRAAIQNRLNHPRLIVPVEGNFTEEGLRIRAVVGHFLHAG